MRGYDLSGRVTLGVAGADEHARRYVARQMDPFAERELSGAAPGVALRFRDAIGVPPGGQLQRPAGDGLVTATADGAIQLVAGDRTCTVPDPLAQHPAVFACDRGFPVAAAFKPFVRTALQLALLRADAVAVHSAAVELGDGAVLFAGWSESGKTEAALAAAEQGARFLSDKWTVVGADRAASAFPIDVGVRAWALPRLPRLRSALPPAARVQLSAAAAATGVLAPARSRALGRQAGRAVDELARVADLAGRAPVSPSEVRAAYGHQDDPARRVPLRALAMLTTVAEGRPVAAEADAGWAARRLARTAAYERRPWFGVVERARFALPGDPRDDRLDAVCERERAVLERALDGARVIEVRAPFPTDPHGVVDAVSRLL